MAVWARRALDALAGVLLPHLRIARRFNVEVHAGSPEMARKVTAIVNGVLASCAMPSRALAVAHKSAIVPVDAHAAVQARPWGAGGRTVVFVAAVVGVAVGSRAAVAVDQALKPIRAGRGARSATVYVGLVAVGDAVRAAGQAVGKRRGARGGERPGRAGRCDSEGRGAAQAVEFCWFFVLYCFGFWVLGFAWVFVSGFFIPVRFFWRLASSDRSAVILRFFAP